MNKVQLPDCGLFRKSAVLLTIFFAIVSNLPAQVVAPAPAAAGARDAQGNILPGQARRRSASLLPVQTYAFSSNAQRTW